jgi:exopolysaccharide production protein ExoZ
LHRKEVSNSKDGSQVIRPIQYLRALAALSVVWVHALDRIPAVTDLIGRTHMGSSGVDLFFVISGFIMRITTHGKDFTAWEFYRHRIVRVVPMYWLCTLAMVAVWLSGHMPLLPRVTPETLAKSLLFIPTVVGPVSAVGWTLNYEMFFYALFAISLALPARFRFAALLATLGGLVLGGYALHPINPIAQTYTGPLLLEFAGGVIIAYLWQGGRLKTGLPVALVSIAVGTYLLLHWNEPPLYGYTQMLGSALVVIGCLHPAICDIRNRPLRVLGDASYSIYLTHTLTLSVLKAVWVHTFAHESFALAVTFMAVSLAVSAAAGVAVNRWVEKTLTARLKEMTAA